MFNAVKSGRFLTIKDVINETSLSRATIYRMIAKGQFPPSIQISAGRVSWREDAIESWKNQLVQGGSAQP